MYVCIYLEKMYNSYISLQKATKKTDKPSVEEKTEQDLTELSNEALKEELVKYGITPGPIMGMVC